MKALFCFAAVVALLSASEARAQPFQDVVKKVEAKIEPKTAKRGAAVKWTLTIELADGWHTYPTKQPAAQHEAYVNKLKFENSASAVFVGELKEPEAKFVNEDGAMLAMFEGTPAWERTLVVRPDAKPGKIKITVPVVILVCNANGCLPPKKVNVEVELTISDAPAVAIDAKYQKEVDAAGKK
jgi:DsbC/DsbD-like thiol-disulfide interchange protein